MRPRILRQAARILPKLSTMVVTTTLPEQVVAALDKANARTLESRSSWLRRAAFDLAERENIIRRPRPWSPAALDLSEVQ